MALKRSTKIVSAIIAAVIIVSALSVWLLNPQEIKATSFSDNFENGLANWVTDAEVPENPNNPGSSVEWSIELSTTQSVSPSHSAKFMIDGLQDDGAIWIEHKLNLEPNAVKNVNVTFQFWSPSESFNTLAAVIGYAGNKNPAAEADLQVIGYADQIEGWKTYTLRTEVTTDNSGNAYVALGIAVLWETHLTYYIDNVTVDFI